MAKREWFSKQRDAVVKRKNLIVYMLGLLGAVGAMVGLGLLPDMVSIAPESPNTVPRPKEVMVGVYFAVIAVFTGLFWHKPRELAYLFGAVFGVLMMFVLLFVNLGV